LCAQDQVADLACGAASACCLRHVVDALLHFSVAVRHADGETDTREDGKIDDVVTDEAAAFVMRTAFGQQLLEGCALVVHALLQMHDAQIGRAPRHDRRLARADDRGRHARLLQ
jgi:hypothetical protein